MTSCDRAQRAITSFFVHRRSRDLDAAHEHMQDCASCREVYDRLFAAEQALATSADEALALSSTEKEMLLQAALPTGRAEKKVARRAVPYLIALGVATSALLIALLVPDRPPSPEFQARGELGKAPKLSLRLLCISTLDEIGSVRSLASETGVPICTVRERLAFTSRNATDQVWYLQVLIRTPAGQIRQVFPPEGDAATLHNASDEHPLGDGLPLSELGEGRIRVFGWFSPRPASPDAAVRAIERGEEPPTGVHLVRSEIEVTRGEP